MAREIHQLGDDEPTRKGSSTYEALFQDDVGQPKEFEPPHRQDAWQREQVKAESIRQRRALDLLLGNGELEAIEEFRQAAREAKAAQEAAQRAAQRYAAAVKKLSEVCTQGDPAQE